MPIEIKNSVVGPGLAAAYAGGVGHHQNEQQDDALRIWQQQQQQAFQGQQAVFNRNQQFDLLNAHNDMRWQERSTDAIEDSIGTLSANIAKKARLLTPEGRKAWSELSGDLRAIQAQRGNLRPAQYSKLLSDWQDKYQASGVEKHMNEPPSISDQWKSSSHEIAPGLFMAQQPDGKWTEVDTRGTSAGSRHYTRDAASLGAELDRIKKAHMSNVSITSTAPPAPLSDDEALKILREREALLHREYGSGPPPGQDKPAIPAEQTPPPPPQPGQWTQESIVNRLTQINPAFMQTADRRVLGSITPEAVNAASLNGSSDPVSDVARASMAELHDPQRRIGPAVTSIPPQAEWNAGETYASVYQGNGNDDPLPDSQKNDMMSYSGTGDEFNKKWATLQPGESLRGPDGKVYVKKNKQQETAGE